MKAAVSLLLLILVVTASTHAQFKRFSAGVEAGPSLASMRGNDVLARLHKARIAYSAGLSFEYRFKKNVAIKWLIAYERKGSRSDVELFDSNGQSYGKGVSTLHLDYMVMPVFAKIIFSNKLPLFIQFGPYAGYLLKGKVTGKGYTVPFNEEHTYLYKRLDIGWSSGIGFNLPLQKNVSVSFELRNNWGVLNTSRRPVVHNGTIKTNSTNCLAGIIYHLP